VFRAMHRLFGSSVTGGGNKKKKEDEKKEEKEEEVKKPTLGDAAKAMDERVKALDSKIKDINQELLRYKDQLKKASPAMKSSIEKRAVATLKRKRMYETQRDSIVSQAFNIEQTSFAIETMQDTHVALAAMKDATATLKVEQQKLSLDEVEDMQDDLADLLEEQDEIQNILSRNYTVGESVDEGDLEAELAGLEDVFEGIELGDETAAPVSLPTNPTTVFTGGVQVPTTASSGAEKQQKTAVKQAVDEYNLPI
jgi:charged multivesicular body protein 5